MMRSRTPSTNCRSRRRVVRLVALIGFVVSLAADVAIAAPFDDTVGPFVARYCGKCHGDAKAEADLHLGKLLKSKGLDDTHEAWLKVVRALERQEMPPAEEPHPAEQERTAVAKG